MADLKNVVKAFTCIYCMTSNRHACYLTSFLDQVFVITAICLFLFADNPPLSLHFFSVLVFLNETYGLYFLNLWYRENVLLLEIIYLKKTPKFWSPTNNVLINVIFKHAILLSERLGKYLLPRVSVLLLMSLSPVNSQWASVIIIRKQL